MVPILTAFTDTCSLWNRPRRPPFAVAVASIQARRYAPAVIDAGVGSEEPGAADPWDVRARLWQRLLDCELTEVYVASDLAMRIRRAWPDAGRPPENANEV